MFLPVGLTPSCSDSFSCAPLDPTITMLDGGDNLIKTLYVFSIMVDLDGSGLVNSV